MSNQVAAPLAASTNIRIRFSEVDSVGIVWHGSYALYFEDAREAFGAMYGLAYLDIFNNGYYAPIVELAFSFKKPLSYGNNAVVTATFRNTPAAKIIFDYEITDAVDGSLIATGKSVQVFLDLDYRLVWTLPPFFAEWKQKHNLS
ncbi:MAG: acyl-CoA thioesterase [Tannerellaceae bacterium]|jgi:acyl-CoA thioester hydrolase|nr:acyl-CoA thioesterase [Tannerellaceae bacterium]